MENNAIQKNKLMQMSHEELVDAHMALVAAQAESLIANQHLQERVDRLTEDINQMKALLFSSKSEKKKEEQVDGQVSMLFNEAEATVDREDLEEQVTIKEHTRSVKKPGKKEADLSKLPKEIVTHSIPEDRLKEIFPGGWKQLPDEIYTNVEYIPAKYIAKEHHIEIYCSKNDDRIVRANHPEELLDGSIVTPSLLAGIMDGKYVNALPLYRMEQDFERNKIPISRQNMAGWIIKCTERYLSLLYDRMKVELLNHSVVHADETPLLVSKDGRPSGSKSYMWVYRSNVLDDKPVVIYEYQKTRKADHPKEFLKGFEGTLVTDGYEVYHKLARERSDEISVAGCWVHLKRRYTDAIKAMGKAGSDTVAGTLSGQAIEKIREIFHKDNELNKLDGKTRLERRKEEIKPLVDAFFTWVKKHRSDVTRKSACGRAFTYTVEQEQYLRTFLDDGGVPMDNNAAERAIRPFCIGKKNWVMSDTIHGAESSAIVYSITETAKANDLRPYEYLKHLLAEIPQHMDDTDFHFLDSLLPWSEDLPKECRG